MTLKEARDLYLKSDCSYFKMCTDNYSGYIEYRQLDLPKEVELVWKNEKIQMLDLEMRRFHNPKTFLRLCEVTIEFRDYEKLLLVLDSLGRIKSPLLPEQSVSVAEAILGKRHLKVRSGLVYWAYDIGQKGIAILLMDQALEHLFFPNVTDIGLEKRIRSGQRLCKKIISNLQLNFTSEYLNHYYHI